MNRLDGRFAAQQIPGDREYQEDDYGLIEREDPDMDEVLLLADGMGGHVSGDTARRMVVKTFAEIYHSTEGPVPDRLRTCLTAANGTLAEAKETDLSGEQPVPPSSQTEPIPKDITPPLYLQHNATQAKSAGNRHREKLRTPLQNHQQPPTLRPNRKA